MFKKEQIKVKINGMNCEHCAKRIEEALKKIKNVSEVKVNLNDSEALLTIKDNISETNIKEVIEEAGYEFNGVIKN